MFKPEVYLAIEEAFKKRLPIAHGIDSSKPLKGKRALTIQAEYFVGAMAALAEFDKEAAMYPKWVVSIMSGRSII